MTNCAGATPDDRWRSDLLRRRDAAAEWILRAQDATPDGGVAAWYHTEQGYCPTSYPEVTGYIVPTMWDLHGLTRGERYRQAAAAMMQWVTSVQRPDGAATAMDFTTPYVFDTGMDVLGWVRAYRETGDARHLDAARRAGDWLVASQQPDGRWTTTPDSSTTHPYHARVAWALLQLAEAAGADTYAHAAVRNLDWVLGEQSPDGWFDCLAGPETTHFLAYACRGLLEAGLLLDAPRYVVAARRLADGVLDALPADGHLAGAFRRGWVAAERSCCLTGSLQFAIVWTILARRTGDARYEQAAARAVSYVSRTQRLDESDLGVRGGVAGSEPIGGAYAPGAYLSWAAKFYVDAVNVLAYPGLRLSA